MCVSIHGEGGEELYFTKLASQLGAGKAKILEASWHSRSLGNVLFFYCSNTYLLI